jgi:RNA polymerase sigma factor (sigma-70 family)
VATTASGIEAARELDELYREHAAEIFRYTYAVLGNRADAEDVTQTTFVNALRALERGERPRTPKNWLITIAHNLIRQRFRQQQTRPREVELDHELPAAEAGDDGPALDDLVRALQRIPPTQRQALVLRELEGRSYVEIAALLEISQSALETLIFRARRSLADELENLVTCDGAELALSRESDGRLGRKERRRLLAHLDECESCARIAARSMKHRRAFKVLAVLPLPFSLTLFKGAPTASAAAGLPTIGVGAGATAGAAAGVGAAGVSAKIAIGLAAVAVAGGAGYEGVQAVGDRVPPRAAAKTSQVKAAPLTRPAAPARVTPVVVAATRPRSTPRPKPAPTTPTRTASAGGGRSAAAPGHNKTAEKVVRAMPTTARKPTAKTNAKRKEKAAPVRSAATPVRGKSATAPGRLRSIPRPAKTTVKTPVKAKAEKPRSAKQPQSRPSAAKAQKNETAEPPTKAEKTEKPERPARS